MDLWLLSTKMNVKDISHILELTSPLKPALCLSASPTSREDKTWGPQCAHLTFFLQDSSVILPRHFLWHTLLQCTAPRESPTLPLAPSQIGEAIWSDNFLANLTMVSQAGMSQLQEQQGLNCVYGTNIVSSLDPNPGLPGILRLLSNVHTQS